MAKRRLPVRKTKEILRLRYACGLSRREIAGSCNVARSTVADYLMRATAAGLRWPESAELTEAELEARLFPTEHVKGVGKLYQWGGAIPSLVRTTGSV